MTVHPITPAQLARLTSDPAFWRDTSGAARVADLRARYASCTTSHPEDDRCEWMRHDYEHIEDAPIPDWMRDPENPFDPREEPCPMSIATTIHHAPPPEANIAAGLRAALSALSYVQRCAGHKLDQPEADSMDRGVKIVRELVSALTAKEGPLL